MQIHVNSDKNITTPENFIAYVQETIEAALLGLDSKVTRVEVHLSDANGGKFGVDDKHCVMEARLEGRSPIVVKDHGGSIHDVVGGSADKLKHSLQTIMGKEFDKQRSKAPNLEVSETQD